MKVVFFGASKFGLKCLKKLIEISKIEITGVLTTPKEFDISYSEYKVKNVLHADFHQFCEKHRIPLIEMKIKMNDIKILNAIERWNPDFILVIGWYHMVPTSIRKIPQIGIAGFHASLLPKYRGGAPLVWAIINGESEVGISFFYFEKGVDTGDIISQRTVPVCLNDTIKSVYTKIEVEGINILEETIPKIADGVANRIKQNIENNYIWPQRTPEDGIIDWENSALNIFNFIRAQTKPYPGAFTNLYGKKVIIWESKLFDWSPYIGSAGEVLAIIDEGPLRGILVATKGNDSPLLLTKLCINKKNIDAINFFKKGKVQIGDKFTN